MAKANIKRIGNKVQIVSAVLVPSKCPLFESLWILSADKTIPSSTKVIIINVIRPNKFITLFIQINSSVSQSQFEKFLETPYANAHALALPYFAYKSLM